MTDFKVGDRVRLTGPEWGHAGRLNRGTVLTIKGTDKPNYVIFEEDPDWVKLDDGWEVELVPDVNDLAEAVRKFASPETGVSVEDIGRIRSIGEQLGISSFEQNVRRILEGVADTVVQKNLAYGNSALNPIRVFSRTDRMEQLYTRLDDKLSRVQKGHEYPGDDTIRDIIGYCTLILIAREGE